MRANFPVTQNEYILANHILIQSKTDCNGIITSVNGDFALISGFSADELVGQPHNIVRHPDTPTELFADLWKTLKAKRIWSGYIKNRRKNGDFYWVKTEIFPHRVGSVVDGYVSSRWKVPDDIKERCEFDYMLFREGKAGSLRFREGEIVRGWTLFDFFKRKQKSD